MAWTTRINEDIETVGNVTFAVIQRSQHAKRGRSGWSGPGEYVMVVRWVDNGDGVGNPANNSLSEPNRKKFGWRWWFCGEGYWNHTGPKSAIGKAVAYAHDLAEKLADREEVRQLAQTRGGAGDPYRMQEVA
jgi:hypothetical protein